MSRATADDQLRFLLSCVKHANHGKIDFGAVSAECGIVSKGAAAKRFERLMKANNIYQSSSEKLPSRVSKAKSKVSMARVVDMRERIVQDHMVDVKDEIDPSGTSYVPTFETGPSPPIKLECYSDYELLPSNSLSASQPLCHYGSTTDMEVQLQHTRQTPELSKISDHIRTSPTLSLCGSHKGLSKNERYGTADETTGSATVKHEAGAHQPFGGFLSQNIPEHSDGGKNKSLSNDLSHETNHADLDHNTTLPRGTEGLDLLIQKEVPTSSVIPRAVEATESSCAAKVSEFGNINTTAHSEEYLTRLMDQDNEFASNKQAVPETQTNYIKMANGRYILILD